MTRRPSAILTSLSSRNGSFFVSTGYPLTMVQLSILVFLAIFCCPACPADAFDNLEEMDKAATLDAILQQAVRHKIISGGIVVLGNRDGIQHLSAYGHSAPTPTAPEVTPRTLFDIASLTKVICTAPAVMKLLEEKQLSLLDTLNKPFPGLIASQDNDITILNLLTHTSGIGDIKLPRETLTPDSILLAFALAPKRQPGRYFRYADINFMLLGNLIATTNNGSLDTYCNEHLFTPLGMENTRFNPAPDTTASIAVTIAEDGTQLSGIVQDRQAARMGGISGHAGLFSTADDLARFAVMLLNQGRHKRGQLFSGQTVQQMVSPYFFNNGRIIRGLGWDIHSPFSSPRTRVFSEQSFGHTGYSGASIWVDPGNNLFIIFLSVRLDYNNVAHFNRLRNDISRVGASLLYVGQESTTDGNTSSELDTPSGL